MTVTLAADTTYQEATSADASAVARGDGETVRVSARAPPGGGVPGRADAPDASGAGPSFTATDVTVER